MTWSSFRLILCLATLSTGWTVTSRAVEPGLKLGMSVNDQFNHTTYNAPYGGYLSGSDTKASHEIVPSIFVGFPMDPWRWVPTMSVLQKSNTRLTYLSFQSDVQYTFPLGNADFYFLASPRLDVLLSDGNSNAVPEYEPVTLGVSVGLGQDISLGKDVLFMEFRYDRDFTSYWHTTGPGYSSEPPEYTSNWYNRLFVVQLGVRVNASRTRKKSESPELWPRP